MSPDLPFLGFSPFSDKTVCHVILPAGETKQAGRYCPFCGIMVACWRISAGPGSVPYAEHVIVDFMALRYVLTGEPGPQYLAKRFPVSG